MSQKYSRQDKLFAIATLLSKRELTPKNNLYKSAILKICAANFQSTKQQIDEYTRALTSAYYADHWANLLGITVRSTNQEGKESTHRDLFIKPQKTAKNNLAILKGMAKRDTFDGVGRLILKEVQLELGPVTPEQIMEDWQNYNTKDTIEQTQDGNVFLIYWNGKQTVEETRSLKPIVWNPQRPILKGEVNEFYKEVIEQEVTHPESDIVDQDFDETAQEGEDSEV